jgi:hypothetical protein
MAFFSYLRFMYITSLFFYVYGNTVYWTYFNLVLWNYVGNSLIAVNLWNITLCRRWDADSLLDLANRVNTFSTVNEAINYQDGHGLTGRHTLISITQRYREFHHIYVIINNTIVTKIYDKLKRWFWF